MMTTRAFVLRTFKHGDSTTILKAYTEHAGAASYIVRSGKRQSKKALLQPLNLLELVADERAGRDMHYVKEMRCIEPFHNLSASMERGTIALFMQEVLYKTLREESSDPEMFAFLCRVHHALDHGEDVRALPLLFTIRLAEMIGVLPEPAREGQDHFDLFGGEFRVGDLPEGPTLPPVLSDHLNSLLHHPLEHVAEVDIPYADRRALLDHMLDFLRHHIEPMGELKSPAILHTVLA